MVKRIGSICVFILIILAGYLQKDELVYLIKQGGNVAIFISILLVAICVFFPLIPFPVLAGMIGAIFGITQGMFVSLIGAMSGTMVFFFITRYGFRDYAREKLSKYPKVQEYEEFLNRNSFLAILASRLVPIIPAPVVNIICGLSKVKWFIFFIASTIGKIPNILLLSFVGATLSSNKLLSLGLYGLYILIIFLINFIIIYRKKSKSIK
ncbi:hypothetical protein BIV60_08780 [Bacillus sp. MUM 116]|uniref:TVP38/TMEM64 family protein n=1 Tax=Bacillus sp. MUM 116 TaxID=1678002 RepID=UPI0008F5B872|nr:TVP38/TMEM64 family protein [Bacillus sp. MUM 116]OIK15627.1 hypothetical protein BIV60_08780 [Bacillus sp. MUM 116]